MNHIHEGSFEPAQFLVENIGLLPGGRALDIAMGNGRNSIYLAENGYRVEGIDQSAEAVAIALERARQAGVSISGRVSDLEQDFTIKSDEFDVIICFYYLQRSLISRIKDALRPDGTLVCETFIIDQRQFGRPQNPDYLLKHNELLEMFRQFRCLRYREGIIGNRAIASIIAQKTSEL
jgi:tellurite methyltransferase